MFSILLNENQATKAIKLIRSALPKRYVYDRFVWDNYRIHAYTKDGSYKRYQFSDITQDELNTAVALLKANRLPFKVVGDSLVIHVPRHFCARHISD